jgi:hypothetical protein
MHALRRVGRRTSPSPVWAALPGLRRLVVEAVTVAVVTLAGVVVVLAVIVWDWRRGTQRLREGALTPTGTPQEPPAETHLVPLDRLRAR